VLDVPYRNQLDGSAYALSNCGPTSLSMALAYYGIDVSPWDLRVRAMQAQQSWVDDEGGYSDHYGVFVYSDPLGTPDSGPNQIISEADLARAMAEAATPRAAFALVKSRS
jgi:hypothetical protein